MNDVKVTKRNGGLARRNPSTDMVTGLIAHGVAVVNKIALGETKRLYSLNDALALGINAAYDTANSVQVYYHISEYFRINPNGELYVMLVAQATTFSDMADPAAAATAKKLLNDAEGAIRILGVAFNPAPAYEPVLLDGLDSGVLAAVAKAQLLAVEMEAQNTPVDAIIIDGREFNGTVAAAKDLRSLSAPTVSVCIHRDKGITANPKGSAVGTLLGIASLARVNENVGWVAKFNVNNVNAGVYLQAATTNNNAAMSTLSPADQETLNGKGYIFLRKISGYPGVFFNDGHTCTLLSDDYAYIENNRTINKVVRGVRTALLPSVSSPLEVDEETGRLSAETAKGFEATAESVIDQMRSDREISGGGAYCDEKQNVLATSEVAVDVDAVPYGTSRKIKASVGFKNPFNQ